MRFHYDAHVLLLVLRPDLYRGKVGEATVIVAGEERGRMTLRMDTDGLGFVALDVSADAAKNEIGEIFSSVRRSGPLSGICVLRRETQWSLH
ncbi:MAG: hypothetical protein ABJN26_09075 [Stappiaceae bacterium]